MHRHTAPKSHILSTLAIALLCLPLTAHSAETDPLAGSPTQAVTEWRRLQYAGQADQVLTSLAPAAPSWVDRKSNAATRDNVKRIGAGVYGFDILDSKQSGDAACVLLRAAWTDEKAPKINLTPFFMMRVNGKWTYLPNPLIVESWYQDVPEDLEAPFKQLQSWSKQRLQELADKRQADAATLLKQWRTEFQ